MQSDKTSLDFPNALHIYSTLRPHRTIAWSPSTLHIYSALQSHRNIPGFPHTLLYNVKEACLGLYSAVLTLTDKYKFQKLEETVLPHLSRLIECPILIPYSPLILPNWVSIYDIPYQVSLVDTIESWRPICTRSTYNTITVKTTLVWTTSSTVVCFGHIAEDLANDFRRLVHNGRKQCAFYGFINNMPRRVMCFSKLYWRNTTGRALICISGTTVHNLLRGKSPKTDYCTGGKTLEDFLPSLRWFGLHNIFISSVLLRISCWTWCALQKPVLGRICLIGRDHEMTSAVQKELLSLSLRDFLWRWYVSLCTEPPNRWHIFNVCWCSVNRFILKLDRAHSYFLNKQKENFKG